MPDLITLADVKTYLWPGETITTWDAILPTIISAVSEQIEREIGCCIERAFYTAKAGLSFVVSALNNKINFDEGGAELIATVTAGTYTGTTLATAIAAALNTAPGKAFTYTCVYSTITGKFTIAAGSNFTIRWNTGTNKAIDISNLCGYPDTANSTGAKTYTSYRVGDEGKASGRGSSLLYLPNWPIAVIISVVDKDGNIYTEGDDEDFVISPGPQCFALQLNDGVWEKGSGNFTVNYQAGYMTIPVDIILIAHELIARKYKTMKGQEWGETSRTFGDGSITSVNTEGALTKAQLGIVAKYQRPIL